ncbi:MAG TPA: bifunctional 3,4-dihydroxy-2-butanone-4-phosphate synthase/GTP cyclohydrolase II [Peptococcaceae bacterium]|nr:MAG: Riboflavin biosynthesis protein RibBA [Moorella sp. 60_41]HBT46361.1 bifunctional 3,4-dihydroxy-2-butanone-4-phosphate synthase/GTP cyclohydrolase II [Peptococcaceae bacterium]
MCGTLKFNTIEEALEDLKEGKMIVVVDDEDRENEGDVVAAAEKVTPEIVNFMATHARGLICVPMTGSRLDELGLELMVQDNTESLGTAFTVSVDAAEVTTGISAYERAVTIKKLIDPATRPEDLRRPGHIFPLRAREGGVLRRAGHTEAAVDLARLAGLYPAGVICEIMNDDGTMARVPQLMEFCRRHGLKIITIADLIKYRRRTEKLIRRVAETNLPTRYGHFRAIAYEDVLEKQGHLALVKGEVGDGRPVLVRVHSECLTGDVFGSCRCDCGEQLARALAMIEAEGRGVLLYMRQEGRGIGLLNKIKAYRLQEEGKDTVEANEALGFPADLRDYGLGAQILVDLGIRELRLLTNNPRKIAGLEGYGLKVVERIPLEIQPNGVNRRYLKAKKDKLGHLLHIS